MPFVPESALILVCVLPEQRDLDIARLLGWYRIPLKSAPKVLDVDYLAFYQTGTFGCDHRWKIEYISPVRGHELVTRSELFHDEQNHPRANEEYFKINIGPLEGLSSPVIAENWKRITFLYSTGNLLNSAKTIHDLIVQSDQRKVFWQSLRERYLTNNEYRTNPAQYSEESELINALLQWMNIQEDGNGSGNEIWRS